MQRRACRRTAGLCTSRRTGRYRISKFRPWRIWMVERQGLGWGEPKPLPAPVNAPERAWNFGASVTNDGTIYFSSSRAADGHLHIYRSRRVDGKYAEPEMLGPE